MVATLEQAQALLTEYEATLARQAAQLTVLQGQVTVLEQALRSARTQLQQQQYQLDLYVKRLYGRKSEHYHPDQLRFEALLLEATPPAPGTGAAGLSLPPEPEPGPLPASPPRPHRRHPHGRLPIPAHLERVVIEVDVPESERLCPRTGEPLVCIGYEESEKLEYRPGRLFVQVYRRAKYASPDRQRGASVGVITAPMPDHPVPKCKADVGLISYAIVSKWCDHLPLYRQDGIFEREGVSIPRSTLDDWVLATADTLRPLGQQLKQAVLDTDVLFTDDTVLPLLERGRGRTRQARMWVYVRGGTGPPLVAYDFTLDRRKERPQQYVNGYQGYIHADAYQGYDQLFKRPGVIEVGCWSHTRRRFDEALLSRAQEAGEVLGHIQGLYQVEAEVRGRPPEERRQGREQRSRPLLARLFPRLEELRATTVPSEPLRTAIDYALNQRQALQRYLEDGRLEADNNAAENAIRPLALSRKNCLFAGSERGGHAAALYLGLLRSCTACQVNPWAYLEDVLRRIQSHPVRRLRELLPDQWQPAPRDARGLLLPA